MTGNLRMLRDQIGPCTKFASGGQARIYTAPQLTVPGESGPFVFKEYKRKTYSMTGLDHIVGFRNRLGSRDRSFLDQVCVWPLRVVEKDGTVDGVVLHLIPDQYFHQLQLPSGVSRRRLFDGQYLAQPPERCVVAGVRMVGLGDRFRICRDMAFALGFLHKREVCFGDISFPNMVLALGANPCVRLVDCDAVRPRGGAQIVEQATTPDWEPPEGSRPQSMLTDRYKLGLFVLRVLTPKALSSQNRDPCWADGALDHEGRDLLRRALNGDPKSGRTAAKEWYAYFNRRLQTGQYKITPHRNSVA